MYCIEEAAILAWKRYNGLTFIPCDCPLSENCGTSTRQNVKELLSNLKKDNKDVEKSVFQSLHMVNLETVIGYKMNGNEHSFLDDY